MEEKFRGKYRIPSARWQAWDYRWDAAYFVTACTKNMAPYFGKIQNGQMRLSPVGVLADVFWHQIKHHAQNVKLAEFVVMPNHIHGILILEGNNPNCSHHGGIGRGFPGSHNADKIIGGEDRDQNQGRDQNQDRVETGHALSVRGEDDETIGNDDGIDNGGDTPGQRRVRNQGKNSLSSIIGSYKAAVSRHSNRLGFDFAWKPRFHDHIIRHRGAYERIAHYIENNPRKWEEDKFFY
ncbi:hypothetical protein FUAX_00300 [Fulvitalea axinellae]|uniref:Transposase IS200-like domain-containing protein n=1 Tax=Fulvitalea axinellae TaxID=1182444 RepID=A0AAU9CVK5_9BACT|nr:hypothetical protein FUAX_00300 [Fulvitalea axinellae]